jgi:hypothetical protein
LSIAGGAALLAALMLLRVRERRRVLPMLRSRHHPALAVQVVWEPHGDALVLSRTGSRLVATYPAQPPALTDAQTRELGRLLDPRELDLSVPIDEAGIEAIRPVDGVLLGDVCDRGWAAVVTEQGVIVPRGPLRPQPNGPRLAVRDFVPDEEELEEAVDRPVWLEDVTELGPIPDLPVEPPTSAVWRGLGWAVLIATAVAAPLVTWFIVEDWPELIPALAVAGATGGWGARRAVGRVRLTHQGLEVVDTWTSTMVPWGMVDAVAAGRSSVAVEWGDAGVMADVYADVHPRELAHERAQALAAGLRTLMDQASREPARRIRRRPSPAAPVVLTGVVATLLGALARFI